MVVGLVAEEDESNELDLGVAAEMIGNRIYRDSRPVFRRVAVDAHADGREGDAARPELIGEAQAGPIGGIEERFLVVVAALPDRPHRMQHPTRR